MANAPSRMGCRSPPFAASIIAFRRPSFPPPSSSFRIARFNRPIVTVQAISSPLRYRRRQKQKKSETTIVREFQPGSLADQMACLPQSRDERVYVVLRDRERLSGATGARTQSLDTQILQGLLLSDELVAHTGCVNRLAWDNDDGTVLASVSDDLKIHLWPFRFDGPGPPAEAGQPFCVETLHTQNIFGVGFLPRSAASLIVTGSMDGSVQLHRLERGAVYHTPRDRDLAGRRASLDGAGSPALGPTFRAPQQVGTHTQTFSCHIDRVKDIEVSRHEPSLFWSCSEDGTVRQYDIRLPNSQQNEPGSANVLLHSPNLKAERSQYWNPNRGSYFGRYFKYQGVNSIRINPVRPELIAVASQSPHVHVFDRRMCSLRSVQSEVTVSLSTGYATSGHVPPVMQLKYPIRELLWQSWRPSDLERDIRPSYVAWGCKGDKLLANYSSGPVVTWSTSLESCYTGEEAGSVMGEERLVAARRTGGSMYEVEDPGLVDSYWGTYKRTVPFDVERSMSDLSRVQTGGGTVGSSPGGTETLRSAKKFVAGLTLEELRDVVHMNDVLRTIAEEYSMFVNEQPGNPDLDKEFLWLLFGEYSLRVGPTLACNLLYLVAHPLACLNFEIAASFISQMVARRLWPLRFVDDPDPPDGEWMAGLEVMEYAESLLSSSRQLWVNRHFHSKRKERTIGARYERVFAEILEALLEEQELRPGTFDLEYWTGDGCREAFGFVLGQVEAGYIYAWVSYFAQAGNGCVAESTLNTPIMLLGAQSRSFEQLYCYHSNENTDIKEAVFFGADDSFVLCASDSGAVVAYDEMAELVCYMDSDATIANCVRPHPRLPIIAWYVSGHSAMLSHSPQPHTSDSPFIHVRPLHAARELTRRSRYFRRFQALPIASSPTRSCWASSGTVGNRKYAILRLISLDLFARSLARSPGRMIANVGVLLTLAASRSALTGKGSTSPN